MHATTTSQAGVLVNQVEEDRTMDESCTNERKVRKVRKVIKEFIIQ
jgi:hypothetical protein